MDIYTLRYEITKSFLTGQGIEIGAGAFPQALPQGVSCAYFDKRTEQELVQLFQTEKKAMPNVYPLGAFWNKFPEGVDFLIAHHVLEHTSNPIKTLLEWHSYVKSGGIVVISVPDANYCPDRGRLIPPFEHLLLDYLLERDDDSFESREHIYSFIMGWIDDGFAKDMDKFNIAKRAHECAHAPYNDLHWHAFDEGLFESVIMAAGLFSEKQIVIEATATPDEESKYQTLGDIIYVYRIHHQSHQIQGKDGVTRLIEQQFQQCQQKLMKAQNIMLHNLKT